MAYYMLTLQSTAKAVACCSVFKLEALVCLVDGVSVLLSIYLPDLLSRITGRDVVARSFLP